MKKQMLLAALLVIVLAMSGCGKDKQTSADKDVIQDTKVEETENKTDATVDNENDADEETRAPEENKNDESNKKPAEKPVEKPAEKPEEKPVEKPAEKPVEPQKPAADTRSLADIMASITTNLGEMPMTHSMAIDEEMFSAFTFVDYVDGAEAYVSEPMMGSFAHSVVLVRLPEGADVNGFASKMKANADPRKWICVEAESVKVSTKGNIVLLVMSSEDVVNKVTSKFLG